MTHDDLDHLLESHDDIVPSSGFSDAVMAAVRREAWQTPPLQFPWKRVALGPLIAIVLVVLVAVTPATIGSALASNVHTSEMITAINDAAKTMRLAWIALALLVTLASVGLSGHLSSRLER
jgi:hypothetical protein